ncbi:hypothetical protein [Thermococcus stetteri]|uniref:hypothetical protein n=1 Tax=Thermococcus stetteri TaxID=49900 RepID=UPI001AE75580|nr:hypothetical protein [Thermococcus stetteri]MBP1912530.1 hypothetical protein [Thermococcus stetteri]
MIGMFIFGGKKEKKREKSYEEILKEAEERFGLPADTIKELAHLYVFNAGLPRLVRHAHPEKDLKHVMRITGSVDQGDDIYVSSIIDAKWREKAMGIKDPRAVKFVLLHPFIALILSHHSSAEISTIGKTVSDALNVFYGQLKKTYEDAKKEQDKLIDYIIRMAEFNRLPIVKEKLREQLRQGLPKAFKIVDKLLPDNSKEHAILLESAFRYSVKDPLVLLKQAGIDIEPELEEFRQFLAEIGGKKPLAPKFKQIQKQEEEKLRAKGVPEDVIKATAPRLATVRYFEEALNAMDHEVYRNMGGVPVEYVKKIRNMALAKKLAAEHIFNVWGKEGIRPVLLPEVPEQHRKLIEEFARWMYEDTKHLAEAHRKGAIAEESVFNIMTAEMALTDKIYEITGKLISDPSALREIPEEHRTALKILTKKDPGTHMIKMDRLGEYKETIKMHLDKTRPIIVKHVEKK